MRKRISQELTIT